MKNIIISIASLKVVKHKEVLISIGLGSCLGIALYDTKNKIAGLAHIMLPDSKLVKDNSNKAKFADTAILQLLSDMKKLKVNENSIIAKIVGGAKMFSFNSINENMEIGKRNIEATTKILSKLNIPIVAKDIGKTYERTIYFYTSDGSILIKTIDNKLKII